MTGAELIAQERQRQIEIEGWSSQHDAEHTEMSLSVAGASYALDAASEHSDWHPTWKNTYKEVAEKVFPFDEEWFKRTPDDPIKQLTKAGALIAAEIDRLQNL